MNQRVLYGQSVFTCILSGLGKSTQDLAKYGLGCGQRHAVDGDHSWGQPALVTPSSRAVALFHQLMHHQRLACTYHSSVRGGFLW